MSKIVNTVDFYKQYADDTFRNSKGRIRAKIDRDSEYYLSKSKFTSILKDIMWGIKELMIHKAFKWIIPNMLGHMTILKRYRFIGFTPSGKLYPNLPTDFKATNELKKKGINKVVYNMNEHTGGYVMTIKYLKQFARFPYKQLYKFHAAKHFRRELAKEIRTNPSIDFYEDVKR